MPDLRIQRSIRVGTTASLTGRYSHPGSQALAGVQAWAKTVNQQGGIRPKAGGRSLQAELVYHDDASDPQRCEMLTERLVVEDRVDILLGPYSSGLAVRAASVAKKHQRVLWNHGGASEAVWAAGAGWAVSILTPAGMYFHGVVDMVQAGAQLPPRVAIVASTAGAFPKEVASGAQWHCKGRGIRAVRTYYYGPGTTDFGPVLEQLDGYHPDLLLGVGRIEDDILLAQQLARSNVSPKFACLIAVPLGLFGDALGGAAEGFLGPSQWEPWIIVNPDYGPSSGEVMKVLAGRLPTGVDYPMAQAYAGCLVAQRCIETAGSLDNAALRDVARRLDFTTFYGRFNIDPVTGRQLGHLMPVVRWQGGKKVVVWPPDMTSKLPARPG